MSLYAFLSTCNEDTFKPDHLFLITPLTDLSMTHILDAAHAIVRPQATLNLT